MQCDAASDSSIGNQQLLFSAAINQKSRSSPSLSSSRASSKVQWTTTCLPRERLKYTAAEGHPSRRVEMRVCEWNTLGLERATSLPLPNVRDACTLFAAAVGACLSHSLSWVLSYYNSPVSFHAACWFPFRTVGSQDTPLYPSGSIL
jgi:hypothetical protein